MLKNVEVAARKDLENVPGIQGAMTEARSRLGEAGRLLVRYSGTQLLCRVMAEGENEDIVNEVVDMVADAIRRNL